jgi:hypothetical protein
MDGEESILKALCYGTIYFDMLNDTSGIFKHVDTFVNLSKNDEDVSEVVLYPFADPYNDASPGTHGNAVWKKVAEGIGNLRNLDRIIIKS